MIMPTLTNILETPEILRFWRWPEAIALLLLFSMVPHSAAQPTRRDRTAGNMEAAVPAQSFAERLLRYDQLPRFRPVVKVGSFSSYDRTGGNDDGFSGKYSFLRKEGDGGLVIAALHGPGALTRIWAAAVTDDLVEFFFDGESSPRLRAPFSDLFSGRVAPFVEPLAGYGAGGYYAYVPLEFAKSIKLVVRAKELNFYQINYILYEPSVAVRTFEPGDKFEFPQQGIGGQTITAQHVLHPGQSATIFETTQPGRITSLKLGPAEAFAGKDRALVLRMYWDGADRPAVEVPAGDFFGYSFGQPAARSLLVGTDAGWNYVRFPMPFERGARIELVSERAAGPPVTIQSELVVSDHGKEAVEGTFHAAWHRENPTSVGKSFTYLDVHGRGHAVGAILQAQGVQGGQTTFFEGDDGAIIDGDFAIHGTGSEDFFNGGWYSAPNRWDRRVSLPLSGCLEYHKHLARTGGYRLFFADAYSFSRSLVFTMEHGGEGNSESTDYTSVTYYYLDRPGGAEVPLPALAARAVQEPPATKLIRNPILNNVFALLTIMAAVMALIAPFFAHDFGARRNLWQLLVTTGLMILAAFWIWLFAVGMRFLMPGNPLKSWPVKSLVVVLINVPTAHYWITAASLALAAMLPLAWRGTGEQSWTAGQKARHTTVLAVFVLVALLAILRGSLAS